MCLPFAERARELVAALAVSLTSASGRPVEAHLVEINRTLTAGVAVPFPNPMGLTRPSGV